MSTAGFLAPVYGRRRVGFLIAALALALAPIGARAEANRSTAAEPFDEASRLVREHYYDRNLGGKDWDKISARHRDRYLAAKSTAERSAAIDALLNELGVSHMGHFTPDEPAYYQLVDIFSGGLKSEIGRHFPDGTIAYPGIGAFTHEIGGKTFVTGVLAGLPAADAGLQVGDEILTVDGAPFEPVKSFKGKVGMAASMSVRRAADRPAEVISLKPESLEPDEAFKSAMRDSARVIEANGKRIGHIRVWSYAGQNYQDILVKELSVGKLKDVDALIWDLRDGWGGAHPRYLDLFDQRGATMTLRERNGEKSIVGFKWRKPVALLVNRGTRSGKEVLTHGFKKYGYGPVIGETTAGAVLAGRGFLLSDGSFLMVAVNDVMVDGERIEGRGVAPTIEVPFEIPYAGGRDPQLEKAVEVLSAVGQQPGQDDNSRTMP